MQLIPELAKKAADLTVYQRTPIWVVPKIDFRFSERAKRLFARVPLTQRAIRVVTDTIYEFMVVVAVLHHRTIPRAVQHRGGRPVQDAPVRHRSATRNCATG